MDKQKWIEESIQKYVKLVGTKVSDEEMKHMYEATEGYATAAIDTPISTDNMANILYNLYLKGFGEKS